MDKFEPSYINLYHNGTLADRLEKLRGLQQPCRICPRACLADRSGRPSGYCHSGLRATVVSVCDHHGEEPVLSGVNGSGTVFFGGCNLRCVFCQNHEISQDPAYYSAFEVDSGKLAESLVKMQDERGVHNINFVSPSHFVPQMVEAIYQAIPLGLHLPVVYNSNGYDSPEVIRLLEGIIDIYLPDLKYADDETARQLSGAIDYRETARAAIREMYKQVGLLKTDAEGLARRGLIIRHLILPNDLSGTGENLQWIASELSPQVNISLMAQYHPMHRAGEFPLLSRGISYGEYRSALEWLERLGFGSGFAQQMDAPEHYLPHFRDQGHPFHKEENCHEI